MKIILGLVFYNPTMNEIKKLDIYKDIFDEVIIYDNSTTQINYKLDSNINYHFNNNNDGLSKNYNKILRECYLKNAKLLCILDQDTLFSEKDIRKSIEFIKSDNLKNVMYAPYMIPNGNTKKSDLKKEYAEWAINSGTFINIDFFKRNKIYYDENLFLDGVDKEIGLRIGGLGYQVKMIDNVYINQQLGYSRNNHICHEPKRHYYISKSRIYINFKYLKFIKAFLKSIMQTTYHILYVVFFEDRKIKKIGCIFKGIIECEDRL